MPLLSVAAFSIPAYAYLVFEGENIPLWIYFTIAGVVSLGFWSLLQTANTSNVGRRTSDA